jgi:C4-dicarboxylate transporter DctQ subunit
VEKISAILDRIERWGIFASFFSILSILTVSILSRYVFRRPLSWPDELTTYLFILMTFLGASASVKDNTELKVEVLYEKFPQFRLILDILLHTIRLGVSIILIVMGYRFASVEWQMGTYTPILRIPVFLIFSMLPFFGILMVFRSVECFFKLWKRK